MEVPKITSEDIYKVLSDSPQTISNICAGILHSWGYDKITGESLDLFFRMKSTIVEKIWELIREDRADFTPRRYIVLRSKETLQAEKTDESCG